MLGTQKGRSALQPADLMSTEAVKDCGKLPLKGNVGAGAVIELPFTTVPGSHKAERRSQYRVGVRAKPGRARHAPAAVTRVAETLAGGVKPTAMGRCVVNPPPTKLSVVATYWEPACGAKALGAVVT